MHREKEKDLISVGKIIGTHGVKGAVKVISLSDVEDRFQQLDRVYLVNEVTEEIVKARIKSVFTHKGMEIVTFEGWDHIEQVEDLKHWLIKIPREERPKLPENEFYFDDILGLQVYDQQGVLLGEIVHIFPTGSNDVYEVSPGDAAQKNILIPALKNVIKEINFEDGYMVIDPPEGLIEEEA